MYEQFNHFLVLITLGQIIYFNFIFSNSFGVEREKKDFFFVFCFVFVHLHVAQAFNIHHPQPRKPSCNLRRETPRPEREHHSVGFPRSGLRPQTNSSSSEFP